MDKRTLAFMNAYAKLKESIAKEDDAPAMCASSEVLGYTGSWLSELTNYELVCLQDQITAQLRDNIDKGIGY